MKLTVLTDNNSIIDRYFLSEPALCFLIQDENRKILFDLGYSDVFMKNAKKMKMPLTDVDAVVLSHGHNDHTGGLPSLITMSIEESLEKRTFIKPELICHNKTFQTKIIDENIDIGSLITEDKLKLHFKMELTNAHFWLTKNLVYLGEIPRNNNFENKKPVGKVLNNDTFEDDYILDDSALAYKSKDGLVIITGCSHSGICNIIEHAKKITGENRVVDIIGGMHLLNPSKEQIEGTINYFKTLNLRNLYPCHCTDLQSKFEFAKYFSVKETGVSMELYYD
ncbi:MAG: MBL fold metallo-hydrolase [Solirubrobacterales bacterium]